MTTPTMVVKRGAAVDGFVVREAVKRGAAVDGFVVREVARV